MPARPTIALVAAVLGFAILSGGAPTMAKQTEIQTIDRSVAATTPATSLAQVRMKQDNPQQLQGGTPSKPPVGGLKATSPRGTKATCGTTTCTCSNDADCDILFTSTKCKEGTQVHSSRTSSGQCTAAD